MATTIYRGYTGYIYMYWDEPYQVYQNKSLKIPKGQYKCFFLFGILQ
jgi:hypothetical protein